MYVLLMRHCSPICCSRSHLYVLHVLLLHHAHLVGRFLFQLRQHPQPVLQSGPGCYRQGIRHLQPFDLRHHPLQIQVRPPTVTFLTAIKLLWNFQTYIKDLVITSLVY